MKKGTLVCLLLLGVVALMGYAFSMDSMPPVGVSPGGGTGKAMLACPTFSWSMVEGATGYRVEVFKAIGDEVLTHDEMAGDPVISGEISGPALSWTPSAEEALTSGQSYAWYVKGVDGRGEGEWSAGRRFTIDATGVLLGMEEAVKETVREYLRTDVVIQETVRDIETRVKDQVVKEIVGQEGAGNALPGGVEGTDPNGNTFYGDEAGVSLGATGYDNTFIGKRAGYMTNSGDTNIFLGGYSGNTNTIGYGNTFAGYMAGYKNTTGYTNSFLGTYAGYWNATGCYNTFVGPYSGYWNVSGNRNVFIGNEAGFSEQGSNKLYIHSSNTPDPLIYGDFSTRILKINGALIITSVGAVSDVSFKKEIRPLTSSLERVANLRGVSYEWKTEEYPDKGFTKERQVGLIAQEVEPLLPELVQTDREGHKSVSYDKLTAVLVEACKELKRQNETQEVENRKQQAEIEELRMMVRELRAKVL